MKYYRTVYSYKRSMGTYDSNDFVRMRYCSTLQNKLQCYSMLDILLNVCFLMGLVRT